MQWHQLGHMQTICGSSENEHLVLGLVLGLGQSLVVAAAMYADTPLH